MASRLLVSHYLCCASISIDFGGLLISQTLFLPSDRTDTNFPDFIEIRNALIPPHTDSKLDCFLLFGDQTSQHLRERFQLGLTTAAVDAYLDRLIVSSIGSSWTRLYDSVSCFFLLF